MKEKEILKEVIEFWKKEMDKEFPNVKKGIRQKMSPIGIKMIELAIELTRKKIIDEIAVKLSKSMLDWRSPLNPDKIFTTNQINFVIKELEKLKEVK